MVRQHTPLRQRGQPQSPIYRPLQRYHLSSHPRSPRSPLAAKQARARTASSGNRYIKSRAQRLPTIFEEDEDDQHERHLFHQLDAFGRDDRHQERDVDDGMLWEDETTLVAMLQDEGAEDTDEDDIVLMAEKLKGPMSAQSRSLKEYIGGTILPSVRQIRSVHEKMDAQVDMTYGAGLLAYNDVCKRVEGAALRTEEELKAEHSAHEKTTIRILGELNEAYRKRDELWVKFEENLGACVERARAAIESLPGDVEDIVTRMEKKSKEMEKTYGNARSNRKVLQGLLERL